MSSSGPEYGILPLDYPKQHIRMKIDTPMESDYRRIACAKEPWTIEFIEQQPSGTWFFDIGANVGSYTLVAVAHGLKVVAIEPSIDSAHKLCENLRLNNWADMAIVYAGGLAERTGFEHFSLADCRPGYNDHVFGKHKHELTKRADIFHTHIIPIMKLDDMIQAFLIPEVPISMKIDVDGGELMILRGGLNALKLPMVRSILLEVQRPNAEEALKILADCGFKETRRIDEHTDLGEQHFGRERFRDMFYIQVERA